LAEIQAGDGSHCKPNIYKKQNPQLIRNQKEKRNLEKAGKTFSSKTAKTVKFTSQLLMISLEAQRKELFMYYNTCKYIYSYM
jgi:hypothetical protein